MTELNTTLAPNGVLLVEIQRGPHNYFDVGLIAELADRLESVGPEVRAVVLASEGRNFCAGASLRGEIQVPSGRTLYDEAVRIFDCPAPIVAAVQGGAIGGGFGLAMAADFRIGASNAWFSTNFTRLGFHHGFALTVTLPDVLGSRRALDLLLTARRVDAAEALELGICDSVVAPDELRAGALDYAATLAANAPLAVRSVRATMRADLVRRAHECVAHEIAEQVRLIGTEDFREGVAASNERREPVFNGR